MQGFVRANEIVFLDPVFNDQAHDAGSLPGQRFGEAGAARRFYYVVSGSGMEQ